MKNPLGHRPVLHIWAAMLAGVVFSLGVAAGGSDVPAPQIKYEKFTLKNGLEVILAENHRLPLVAVDLWYHVGPANERAGRTGFGIAQRSEVDPVGLAVRHLPVTARFAVFPTYNHPILLQGRKAVLGYPGHLWTQGFNYSEVETKLKALMLGRPEWRDLARALETRYLFWGKEEKTNYAASARPWERELKPVASGPWGTIYDLQAASSSPRPAAR